MTRVKLKTKLEATFLSIVTVFSLFSSVTGIRQVEAAGTALMQEDCFVHTIEGNTSNNKVERHTFSLSNSYILGYGIVNYSEKSKTLDIGNNVCGLIFRQDAWKPIRNTGSNVELWGEKGTGDYYWLFKRQSDGSYEIQSMYDGKVLDARGIGTTGDIEIYSERSGHNM